MAGMTRRAIAAAARMLGGEEHLHDDTSSMFYYTPEDAEALIRSLEADPRDYVVMECGTNELVTHSKAEMIARIRSRTRR